ncbi:MAG TPA: hypothetical protein VGM64_22155 [Lacunisphaera sp.]|jgi:hypothetical protein
MKVSRIIAAKVLAWSGAVWAYPVAVYLLARIGYLPALAFQVFVMGLGMAIWVLWILVARKKIRGDFEGFIWALASIYHVVFARRDLADRSWFSLWYVPVAIICILAFISWLRETLKAPNQSSTAQRL